MAQVCIHPNIADNLTVQGYARELSSFLSGVSLSGRLGKNGGFERNTAATASGIMKIHIKAPGEEFWRSQQRQTQRISDNYLVYARHWDMNNLYQVIAIVTPDAHARIDGLLPGIIKAAEAAFHDLNESQLTQYLFY